MDQANIIMNTIVLFISLHLTGSSLWWVIKHRKNGWVYGVLPLVVGLNVLAFTIFALADGLQIYDIDDLFLKYWSQTGRILTLICFAVAIRAHLRYIKRIDLSGFYK